MNDTKDLIREIQEHIGLNGTEDTATHLLVQAAAALQRQADELAAIGAGGVSGQLMGGAALAAQAPQQAAPAECHHRPPCAECAALAKSRRPDEPAPQQAALPEGWVPLVINHEGQYPEEIAYGPQRMMDRLDKWLRKYFESLAAAKPQQEVPASNESAYQRGYIDGMAKGRRDAEAAPQQAAPAVAMQQPMFWVRLCGDGMYEGPIHNARIEEVRRQSGAWSPLYLHPAPQQEVQEPCKTCVSLARTVMLDQTSFDRKPDAYGIRQITDDDGVEEWEDIRTSPDVAREEADDMMATGRGETYEVVPLWTTPQPAPSGDAWKDGDTAALVNQLRDVAVQCRDTQQLRERIARIVRPLAARAAPSGDAGQTYEHRYAIRQGHEIAASNAYFEARPQIDSNDRRKVFQAGFKSGWDAARKEGK